MNAERWKNITSSFSSLGPKPQSHQTAVITEIPQLLSICSSSDSQDKAIITELQSKISILEALLAEKSQIVLDQQLIISKLEKIETYKSTTSSHSENPPQQNFIKLNKTSACKPQDKTTISQVIKSIEDLESRMNKLVTSLPQKINTIFHHHMSKCRFKLEESESGQFLVLEETLEDQPIWNRKPSMQPRVPYSKAKQRTHTTSNFDPDNVQVQLKRMENLVEELKVNFIQLLLDKLAVDGKCRNLKVSDQMLQILRMQRGK